MSLPSAQNWAAAPQLLPEEWVEARHAVGEEFEEKRTSALKFASRRRRESESRAKLASEPLEPPPSVPVTKAKPRPAQNWPEDAPPRPIHQAQLFADAWLPPDSSRWRSPDLESIEAWIAKGAKAVAAMEARDDAQRQIERLETLLASSPSDKLLSARLSAARKARVALPRPDPPSETFELAEDRRSTWSLKTIWNCENPLDCYPEQPSTPESPPECEVNRSFFQSWASRLGWTDDEMLYGIASGVDSGAECDHSIVLRFHHQGFRHNFRPARESVESDSQPSRGWIGEGSPHPRYIPIRLIAKNIADQSKWKLDKTGKAYQVIKYRVTTDDSAENVHRSRNNTLPRDEWHGPFLPTVGGFARAIAILKSWMPDELAVALCRLALESGISEEKVVLWAIDLTDAYRILAIQRLERWLQCFVWSDGCRPDYRAVFGTASMVQFFGRVSLFLQAVTRHRIREWNITRPTSDARKAWMERRGGCDSFWITMYIDGARPRYHTLIPPSDEPTRFKLKHVARWHR